MSEQSSHDPRDRMVREKYFTLRPKPLERWLWQQGLPQAAERVFWLHWEEGMRNRDWCSQLPLRRVASLCCVDPSTVTRAYQLLKALDLIRREDPGRDAANPFQQATVVTEVRVPRELLVELARSPNRPLPTPAGRQKPQSNPPAAESLPDAALESAAPGPAHSGPFQTHATDRHPTRQAIQATWGRASATERSRFFSASRNGIAAIAFDADTRLTPEDRGQLLNQLQQMAHARTASPQVPESVRGTAHPGYAKPRRLSPLELARARKRVFETVAGNEAQEVLRQVVWAVEEGALRRFEMPLAVNIALKKIREGAWSRPNRMPPNWSRLHAVPETCSAA
jgi:hypothetical protein